eukprot:4307323-Pleurochrysis_carterae.AAC.3
MPPRARQQPHYHTTRYSCRIQSLLLLMSTRDTHCVAKALLCTDGLSCLDADPRTSARPSIARLSLSVHRVQHLGSLTLFFRAEPCMPRARVIRRRAARRCEHRRRRGARARAAARRGRARDRPAWVERGPLCRQRRHRRTWRPSSAPIQLLCCASSSLIRPDTAVAL